MDFFKELQNVARQVEHGVRDTQRLYEERDSRNDTDYHSTRLMLRKKNKDITEMLESSSNVLKNMQHNGFVETVTACENLLEKNRHIFGKIETHLKQYGYKSLVQPVMETQLEHNNDVEGASCEGLEPAVTLNSAPDEEVHTFNTPEQASRSSSSEIMTPKLAEFGISESTMKMLFEYRNNKSTIGTDYSNTHTQMVDNTFKIPGEPMSSLKQPRHYDQFSEKQWLERPVPEVFENDGLLVTPALMPGIMNDATPAHNADYRRLRAAYYPSPMSAHNMSPNDDMQSSVKCLQLGSDISENLPSRDCSTLQPHYANLDSPIPPVFSTPGIKQIRKPILETSFETKNKSLDNTPVPPILMTPGLKTLSAKPVSVLSREMIDNDTPEPPAMETPGIRQLHKAVIMDTKETVVCSSTAFKSNVGDNFDTPEPPTMTSQFGALLNFNKYARSNSCTTTLECSAEKHMIRKENQLKDITNENTKNSPNSDFIMQLPVLRSFEDICDTPEAPELTFSYKEILSKNMLPTKLVSSSHSMSPPATSTSSISNGTEQDITLPKTPQISSSNDIEQDITLPKTAQISSRFNIDELETPKMPELTGTISFQVDDTKSINKNVPTMMPDKGNHCPNVESAPVLKKNLTQSYFSQKSSHCFPEEVNMCVYIPQVNDTEYLKQPSYVKNIMGKTKINHSIQMLNHLLADRLKAGDAALVSEEDVQNDLESEQIMFFFLCMMRLRRLSPTYIDGKKYYCISSIGLNS